MTDEEWEIRHAFCPHKCYPRQNELACDILYNKDAIDDSCCKKNCTI
jgi:hypothetical protein